MVKKALIAEISAFFWIKRPNSAHADSERRRKNDTISCCTSDNSCGLDSIAAAVGALTAMQFSNIHFRFSFLSTGTVLQ